MTDLRPRLDFARKAAQEAERIILEHYQSSSLAVERKADTSPVTAADRGAELRIRELIREHFPLDGVLGEEFGEQPGTSGFRWILDPVDGTKSFIYGVPLFGTLIGCEYQGECVIGVCNFPALGECAWGARDLGAWWKAPNQDPRPARVTKTEKLSDALFCFTTVQGFGRIGRVDAFDELVARTALCRGWGDCYGHYLVAVGRADVMVDPLMNPWDAAALIPIIQEAGGHFVNWSGTCDIHAGNGISVNAKLKDALLEITQASGGR